MKIANYFERYTVIHEALVPLLRHNQLEGDGVVEKALALYILHLLEGLPRAYQELLDIRDYLHEEEILAGTAAMLTLANKDDDVLRGQYRELAGLIFEQQWDSAVKINDILERINKKRSPGITRDQIVYAAALATGVYDALLREAQPFNPELDINELCARVGRNIKNKSG